MEEYLKDERMKYHDKIDDIEFACILVTLTKTKMPIYQMNQIVLHLYDKFYQNWKDKLANHLVQESRK